MEEVKKKDRAAMKTEMMAFKLSKSELKKLRGYCDKNDMVISSFIRHCVFKQIDEEQGKSKKQ